MQRFDREGKMSNDRIVEGQIKALIGECVISLQYCIVLEDQFLMESSMGGGKTQSLQLHLCV